MPYSSNSDLPPGVRNHLPAHAQDIYREAFNHALTEYAGEGESAAHRVAWAAVEKKYEKRGDQWVAK
jgi:cation transport regulator